jgi:(2R)-sulfolactate sulfo-lyase subunit alpha
MAYQALAHRQGDAVAVAVSDIAPGTRVEVRMLDGSPPATVTAAERIPLGHKVALRPLAAGEDVIEYGERIGRAKEAIAPGAHVHVHNLRSARWPG